MTEHKHASSSLAEVVGLLRGHPGLDCIVQYSLYRARQNPFYTIIYSSVSKGVKGIPANHDVFEIVRLLDL